MIAPFLLRHWRAALVLLLIAGAFVGGYATHRPADRIVERVEYRDRVVERKVEAKAADKVRTVVVYRDRVTKPDGTKVEHTETREASDARSVTEHVDDKAETREATRVVEAPRPAWRVGMLAGADARNARLLPPDPGPPVLGGFVERRVVGPLSVGVWGLNAGPTVGVSLSVEF